ncbi:hypothetical protein L195_g008329 [Trifolium pratense]|uniref:Uncharacterized protein n=1 Tax=Trifolium pratense TaxID=57577 RepID=A0A2K3P8W4_TRIPR|nr:hypothetical protein L195_g008329 [Trifolium pratense]
MDSSGSRTGCATTASDLEFLQKGANEHFSHGGPMRGRSCCANSLAYMEQPQAGYEIITSMERLLNE